MGTTQADTPAHRRAELRKAVVELRERGLYESAKWAAELMAGLPRESGDNLLRAQQRSRTAESFSASTSGSEADQDLYLLAKSIFDVKEFRRVAHLLRNSKNSKALFLRCYSLYLAGEKRKDEERIELSGPLGKAQTTNKDIIVVESELRQGLQQQTDAFCLYLLGMVLCDREQHEEACTVLHQSIQLFPCNWGAWRALQVSSGGAAAPIAEPTLPRHWMRDFYLAGLCLESRENEEGLGRLQSLQHEFPFSDWIVVQAATAQYHLRNFDAAEDLFQDLLQRDPHRIEGIDEYSNILYVKEQPAALSHLAHRVSLDDKYRSESCCIIGNYYSLSNMHEKAVVYFQRALKQDRRFLNAWTLMGHEYVEMKNPPAAIDAYRRATDLNSRDYRAWYGLGQTYELLQMPFYALHYFRRATELRPNDARMWCAMGQCYENEQLGMTEGAIRCYRRAAENGEREGIALHKLATLHEALGQAAEAAHYFQQNLLRIDAAREQGSHRQDALLFLATFKKDGGELAEAEAHCLRLLDVGGATKDKAKALLREIRSLQQQRGSARSQPAYGAPEV